MTRAVHPSSGITAVMYPGFGEELWPCLDLSSGRCSTAREQDMELLGQCWLLCAMEVLPLLLWDQPDLLGV